MIEIYLVEGDISLSLKITSFAFNGYILTLCILIYSYPSLQPFNQVVHKNSALYSENTSDISSIDDVTISIHRERVARVVQFSAGTVVFPQEPTSEITSSSCQVCLSCTPGVNVLKADLARNFKSWFLGFIANRERVFCQYLK